MVAHAPHPATRWRCTTAGRDPLARRPCLTDRHHHRVGSARRTRKLVIAFAVDRHLRPLGTSCTAYRSSPAGSHGRHPLPVLFPATAVTQTIIISCVDDGWDLLPQPGRATRLGSGAPIEAQCGNPGPMHDGEGWTEKLPAPDPADVVRAGRSDRCFGSGPGICPPPH